MVALMERLPDENPDPLAIPDGMLLRPTVVCIFDNIADRVTVVTPVWPEAGLAATAAYDRARERLGDVLGDFQPSPPHRREAAGAGQGPPAPPAHNPRPDWRARIETREEENPA